MNGNRTVNDLQELLKTRRSIRQYDAEPLPERALETLLEAMRWAPSAGNAQPVRIHVVRDGELKARLVSSALNQSFIAQATVVLVVAVDLTEAYRAYGDRGVTLYCLQDAAAAIQNLLLAAHALGLGACWIGAFDERAVARHLTLLPDHRPVAIVPVGKSAESPRAPARKALAEIVTEH